jgi:hypothetical protein
MLYVACEENKSHVGRRLVKIIQTAYFSSSPLHFSFLFFTTAYTHSLQQPKNAPIFNSVHEMRCKYMMVTAWLRRGRTGVYRDAGNPQ